MANGVVGALRVEVNGGNTVGSRDLRDDEWHHVAGELDPISGTQVLDVNTVGGPHWVKLTRTGDTLTAQDSADGVTWGDVVPATNPTSDTVVMGGTIYLGLALTSQIRDMPGTAQFSGIQTTGNVTGRWEQAETRMDHPDNAPQRLFVALEDSAHQVAVVPCPRVNNHR